MLVYPLPLRDRGPVRIHVDSFVAFDGEVHRQCAMGSKGIVIPTRVGVGRSSIELRHDAMCLSCLVLPCLSVAQEDTADRWWKVNREEFERDLLGDGEDLLGMECDNGSRYICNLEGYIYSMAWHQRVGLYLFRDRLSMDRVWPPSTAVVTPEAGVTFSLGNNSQIPWGPTDHLGTVCPD